jgi:hypothetical protein
MSIMLQTVQIAFRVALVWAGGFVLAVAVRAILPDHLGFTFTSPQNTVFVPYSRVGFWTCLLAAVTVTALVVIRSMLVDFGLRQMR